MKLRLGIFVSLLLAACADTNPVTGGSGAGGNGSTGGSGGAGATGGVGGSGGEEVCEEDPCKIFVPQCGCEVGESCSIDGLGGRICVTAGVVPPGGACSATAFCRPGSVCINAGSGVQLCAEFCTTDEDCVAPGGKCDVVIGSNTNEPMCTENCELIASSGCDLAGTSCQLIVTDEGVPGTQCRGAGAGVAGDGCTTAGDCAPQFTCSGGSCLQWCNVALPDCPNDGICAASEINDQPLVIGGISYGTCVAI